MREAPYQYPFSSVGLVQVTYVQDGYDEPVVRSGSGFLIRDQFILTAAHTLVPRSDKEALRGVKFRLWGGRNSRAVTDWQFHPSFKVPGSYPDLWSYDLVIGKLAKPYKNRYPLALKGLDGGDRVTGAVTIAGHTHDSTAVHYATATADSWPTPEFGRSWPIFLPAGTAWHGASGGPATQPYGNHVVVIGLVQGETTVTNQSTNVKTTRSFIVPLYMDPTEKFIRDYIRRHG